MSSRLCLALIRSQKSRIDRILAKSTNSNSIFSFFVSAFIFSRASLPLASDRQDNITRASMNFFNFFLEKKDCFSLEFHFELELFNRLNYGLKLGLDGSVL